MSKIIELRNKRNTLWEQTKAFLEEHRDANGLVEASAVEQYNKMASDVKALGDEIADGEIHHAAVLLDSGGHDSATRAPSLGSL